MANLEELRKTLAAEAEGEAAEIVAEAQRRAGEILAQAEAKARQLRDEALAHAAGEVEERRRQGEAEERLLRRQALLEAKAGLLARVSAAAKDAVLALPDDQYLGFLVRLVASAAPHGETRVVLNERDRARLGARLVEEATRALAARGGEARLSLARETAGFSGGVKLQGASFEVDCSLERLVELAAEELEPDVARILFA